MSATGLRDTIAGPFLFGRSPHRLDTMLTRFFRTLCLDGAAAPGAGAPPAIPPATPERRATSMVDRLISRHGSAESALAFMATQAVTAEDTIQAKDTEILQLRSRVPAEGSIVLPKAEAEAFATLKALGTPAEITAAVKERDTLKGEVALTGAKTLYRSLAKAAGLDEDAFEVHALREKLLGEVKPTPTVENGKTVTKSLAFVRKDATAAPVALSDYLTGLPAHEQRALKPTPGQPYLPQNPSPTTPTTNDIAGAYINRMNERAKSRPNPLLPKPQVAAAVTP